MPGRYYIYIFGSNVEAICTVGNLLTKKNNSFPQFAVSKRDSERVITEKNGGISQSIAVTVTRNVVKSKISASEAKQCILEKQNKIILLVRSDRTAKEDNALDKWIKQELCFIPVKTIEYQAKTFGQIKDKQEVRKCILEFLWENINAQNVEGCVDGAIQQENKTQPTLNKDPSVDRDDEGNTGDYVPLSLKPREIERNLYRDTLREGKAQSNLVPVIVVGNENAGKTTLINRFLALDNPSKNLGGSCTTSCVINNDVREWETVKNDYVEELNLQRMAQAMESVRDRQYNEEEFEGEMVADAEKQVHQESESGTAKETSNEVDSDELLYSDCLDDDSPSVEKKIDYEALARTLQKDKYLTNVAARVNQSKEPRMFFTYREYGGLDTNVLSYQAFLPPQAVYLLVIDLSLEFDKKLSASMKEKFTYSKCLLKEYTLREMIKFWALSIRRYARDKDDEPASIILVATRRDRMTENEADMKVKKIYDLLQKLDIDDPHTFHIDARQGYEEELKQIRDCVLNISLAYRMEEIPAQWIELEHEIQLKRESKASMSFQDLKLLDMESDIPMKSESELISFLEFQHNSGQVIFIPNLEETSEIILIPNVFIEFLRTLKAKGKNRRRSSNDYTITKSVVTDTEKCVEDKLNVLCDFSVVLKLLMYFNVLIPFSHLDKDSCYFLPCLLSLMPNESKAVVVEKAPAIQIEFVDCHMHPMFYYQFVFSLLKSLKCKRNPDLFELFCRIFVDKQTVYFEVQWIESSIYIWLKNLSDTIKLKDLQCHTYLNLIKNQLEVSLQKQSQEKVKYHVNIECDSHEMSFVRLKTLEDDKEAVCKTEESTHAVYQEALGVYLDSLDEETQPKKISCQRQLIFEPRSTQRCLSNQPKPSDKQLGRLALHLKDEELLGFARLLGGYGCIAETNEIKHDTSLSSAEQKRMELLDRWKKRNQQGSIDDLITTLTHTKDYADSYLRDIMNKEVPSKTFGLERKVLEEPPSSVCLGIVSEWNMGNYPFIFLELGLSWTEIRQAQQQHLSELTTRLYHMFDRWKKKFPGKTTLHQLLSTVHNISSTGVTDSNIQELKEM